MNNVILTSLTVDELKQVMVDVLKEHPFPLLSPTEFFQDNDLLTINEAIKLLKVSKPTLWSYTKEGIVQKHRLGSKVYYKRSELLRSLKEVQATKYKKRC